MQATLNPNFIITDEPLTDDSTYTDDIYELMEKYHRIALGKSKISKMQIRDLEKIVRQYPKVNPFKNYLVQAYVRRKAKDKAKELLIKHIEEAPDYLFAKINLAQLYMMEGETLEKIHEIIPENTHSLQDLYPNKTLFHVTEFFAFESFWKEYTMKNIGATMEDDTKEWDVDALRKVLDNKIEDLKKVGNNLPEYKEDAKIFVRSFGLIRSQLTFMFFEKENRKVKTVEATFKPFFEEREEMPEFTHEEAMAYLYEYGLLEFPKDKLQEILDLPRASLIADLEKVLAYTQQIFQTDKYYIDELGFAHIHAGFLLAELNATESWEALLNMMRQDEEFFDSYYGDFYSEYLFYPIYKLSEQSLEKIKSYLLEEDNYETPRMLALTVVPLIAVTHNRREEGIQWLQEIYTYFFEQRENPKIFDGNMMGFSFEDLDILQSEELLEPVQKFFDENLISKAIAGDFDKVKERLLNPPFLKKVKTDLSIFDIYEDDISLKTFIEEKEGPGYATFQKEIGKLNSYIRDEEDDEYEKDIRQDLMSFLSGKNPFEIKEEQVPEKNILPSSEKKYNRNDKVTVQYENGKMLKDVKFKKIQKDWEEGKCEIID